MTILIGARRALLTSSVSPAGPVAPITLIHGTGGNGTLASGFSSATSATLPLITTADCPAGSLIIVNAAMANPPSRTPVSVADSASNTYHAATANIGPTGQLGEILYYCYNANFLPSGSTITITFSASISNAKFGIVTCFTGFGSSDPLDIAGTGNTGTSNNPLYPASGVTASLAKANELVIVHVGFGDTSALSGGGFTYFDAPLVSFSGQLWMGYQIVSSITGLSAALTSTNARSWGCNLVTFKGN